MEKSELLSSEAFVDRQNEGDNYLICEACGFKLFGRGCKLRCGRCGYFRAAAICFNPGGMASLSD